MEPAEEVLSRYPFPVRDLGEKAMDLLHGLLPGSTEYPDVKAGLLGYGYSNKYIDQVCTIIFSKKGIKIGFNRGTELPDPKGLLEGTGKVHKYVQINTPDDLDSPHLKALIKQGYKAWKERTSG